MDAETRRAKDLAYRRALKEIARLEFEVKRFSDWEAFEPERVAQAVKEHGTDQRGMPTRKELMEEIARLRAALTRIVGRPESQTTWQATIAMEALREH